MIQKQECFLLGRIAKTHNLDGTLLMILDADQPEHYKNLKMFFAELNNQLMPFFIEKIKIAGTTAFVKPETFSSADDAEMIIGADVYLPLSELPPLTGNEFYYHEIPGFKIFDEAYGEVGIVKQLFDMPQQIIAQVFHGEKEVLIPLQKDFVVKIDREKKELHMLLPDGLLQVYL